MLVLFEGRTGKLRHTPNLHFPVGELDELIVCYSSSVISNHPWSVCCLTKYAIRQTTLYLLITLLLLDYVRYLEAQ